MNIFAIFIVFILTSCPRGTLAWWRRRRRRNPPPVTPPRDCAVSGWSGWHACTHHCGNAGTQSRSRVKTVTECCGGKCIYHLSESRPCNRNACQHGGTPRSGSCACPAGWTGTCCQHDVNECLSRPCQHNCHNVPGSFTCSCQTCYTKSGTRCNLAQCKIATSCYSFGTVNPINRCQMCKSTNPLHWTNDNSLKCSDGVLCTRNDRCVNGVCQGTRFTCRSCEQCDGSTCKIKPGYCVIAGTCYRHNDIRSGKPCQQCNSNNPTKWTANNNLRCSDGNAGTRNDRCMNGECRGEPYTCLSCQEHYNDACRLKAGYCVIKFNNVNTCYSKGTAKPGNPCQWCDTAASTTVWTNRNGVSCDDGQKCTKSDTCQTGQCKGVSFSCNNVCQYCNGASCSQHTGYGYVAGKCTCKIAGKDYSHQQMNPGNECQWCDLYDKTTKTSLTWSNRPSVTCDDKNACTKQDLCQSGTCAGTPYTCRTSYPQSSCIQTSSCVGDGTCRDTMKNSGTICEPAVDQCDQPERCNGVLGSCPTKVITAIKITDGKAAITASNFLSSISFQSSTNTLHLKLSGFSASCGALAIKWSLLDATDTCALVQSKANVLSSQNNNALTGLTLQSTKVYKIVVLASDIRGNAGLPVCSNPVTIDTSTPTGGWIRDGLGSSDVQYQSSKAISASWGGFQTTHGIARYLVAVEYKAQGANQYSSLQGFTNANLDVSFTKTFAAISDGSHVKTSVRAFTKAGLHTQITSNGVVVDTSPPSPGTVFDGELIDRRYVNWTTAYQASWTKFVDPHSPIVNYKLGVKNKDGGLVSSGLTSVGIRYTATLSGLNLVSGSEYCAIIEGVNAAGLSSQVSSNCVLIDHDAPRPGKVNDGRSTDIDYQSSDKEFYGNWNGFSDAGSGINEYRYKIEDKSGKQVTSWTSSGLQTTVRVQGLSLANDQTYVLVVRAVDKVGWYVEVKSDGVHVDTTRPVYTGKVEIVGETGSQNDKVYVNSKTSLEAKWPQFIDEHSGMMKYQWAITENNVQPTTQWKNLPGVALATSAKFNSLTLSDGKEYRLHIRGFNNAGLHTDLKSTIIIPLSAAPGLGTVSDGGDPTTDLDYQTNTSEVRATWSGFDESNLKAYHVAVGSCIVGNYHVTNNDFVPVNPARATSFSIFGVNLVNGQRYCVKVKAENLAGVETVPVSSDGFTVDVTSPDIKRAMVLDGSGDDDIDFQSSTTEISATWTNLVDHESGINHFKFAISRSRVGPPDVTSFSNVGTNTSARISNLNLAKDVYYVIVCVINNAGLQSCVTSDGVLIDPTVSAKGVVHDGIIEPDIQYQSSTTKVCANWEGTYDLESRIERFKWGISASNEPDAGDFMDARLETHVCQETVNLKHGLNYTVFLNVYNRAGGVRKLRSNGVVIDTTAPVPSEITPTGAHWSFVPQTNTYYSTDISAGINIGWGDFVEPESEVWYYKWSLGSSSCATQIQPFINIGLLTAANTTASDVTLRQGLPYYVTVMARNRADLVSRACSPAMILDESAPSGGKVEVTSDQEQVRMYYSNKDEIVVRWEGFEDPESGVNRFVIVLEDNNGTSVNFIKNSTASSLVIPSSQFHSGFVYHVSITCINNAGLSTSGQAESFTIDTTPPVYGGRTDSLPRKRFGSLRDQITLSWEQFVDQESGVVSYDIGVGTTPLRDDLQAFRDNGLATETVVSAGDLEHDKVYYVTVRANNAANLPTSLLTHVLLIDNTAPTGARDSVLDGTSGDDVDFMSIHDKISAHWENIEDLESGVAWYEYCVGTSPSNCKVKQFTNVYMNNSVVCHDCQLCPGGTFYVTLRVVNTAGLSTMLTSDGVTVDMSPPYIGIVYDGDRTGFPDVEKATVAWQPVVTWHGAQDLESGIRICEWQIVEHGGNSDVIIYQKRVNVTGNLPQTMEVDTNLNITYNTSYSNVIQCSNKAGISTKRSSNGWSAVDEWPVTSYVYDGTGDEDIDYDVIGQTIGASWGEFHGDAKDPVVGYEWSLGTQGGLDDVMKLTELGLERSVALSLSDTDISLEPGTQYYVTVRATSQSGWTSTQTSDGFMVDTTSPRNGEVTVSHVITEKKKIDFTISWEGFEDEESGIQSYEYCLGKIKDICFTPKKATTKPGHVTVSDVARDEIPHYAIVIATNRAGLKTIRSSELITIDVTGPVAGIVLNGYGEEDWDYINSSVALVTSWFGFHDPETGIKKCTLSVLEESISTVGSMKTMPLLKMEVGANGSVTHNNLTLSSGIRYISHIECSNSDGLKAGKSSNGVIVDDTPPVAPAIRDGSDIASDTQYQISTDILAVNWLPAKDPESGIKEYMVAVGSGSSDDDVREFFSVGLATEVKIQNLTLTSGSSYYVTMESINNAELKSRVSTNGVIIDTSPPVLSELKLIHDTFIGGENDIGATWSSSDEESDVMLTEYCVGSSPGGCQVRDMTMVLQDGNMSCDDCQLQHKHTYFMTVRVWNNAGLFSLATTPRVQADITSPITGDVTLDKTYMPCVNRCTLSATLRGFRDDESGIRNCEFKVQSSNGSIVGLVQHTTSNRRIEANNLTLVHGESYQLVVSCINNVGEKSKEVYSSPVLIDNTPPEKGRVIVNPGPNYDMRGEHTGCHFINSTLRVHWSAFHDQQSDIEAFRVGLGRRPFTDDVISTYQPPHISSQAQFLLDDTRGLSRGNTIYVTVTAVNKAGLSTRVTSLPTRLIADTDGSLVKQHDFHCVNV